MKTNLRERSTSYQCY